MIGYVYVRETERECMCLCVFVLFFWAMPEMAKQEEKKGRPPTSSNIYLAQIIFLLIEKQNYKSNKKILKSRKRLSRIHSLLRC